MNAPETLFLPPHSVEAEQSLIGGLLIGGEPAWDAVADRVCEADFYRDDHRRIYRHIRALAEAGKAVDVLTVDDSIREANESEQTGGLGYLGEIANNTPSAARVKAYADVVCDKARRRRLMAIAAEIDGMACSSASAQDAVDGAQRLLMDAADASRPGSEPKHIAEVVGRAVTQIEARMDAGEVFGLPTGFDDLDRLTAGMHAGDLVIIAGRPAMGKTAVAINIAENVALSGKAVLVFSLEMGDTQLAMRSLASIGGAAMNRVRSGAMHEHEWDAITVAMGKLYSAKLWIDETPSLSAAGMLTRARKIKRQHGLDLIVIDYLQLMTGDGNNRNEQLGDITRRLKLMARSLGVPVVLLSQLSRKVEERTDKQPMMSDLRESGSIEQDADAILMVYRDDYYNPDSPWKGLAELLLVKNRMGETGGVKLVFQPEYSRFRNADPQSVAEANQRAHEARPVKKRRGFED